MTAIREARETSLPPANPPKKARQARGDIVVGTTSHVLTTAWTLIVVLPLLWVLLSSFKTTKEILASPFTLPATWNFNNYVNAWNGAGIGSFFANTIIVVGCALIIVMLLGAMCAYVLARFRFFGARAIYYLMLAGLTFPIFLAIVPLFSILKNIGLLDTLPGLILTYVAFALRSQCSSCTRSFWDCRTRSMRRLRSTGPASGAPSSR
jgi:N-acetylglucosamine transport system permease protein